MKLSELYEAAEKDSPLKVYQYANLEDARAHCEKHCSIAWAKAKQQIAIYKGWSNNVVHEGGAGFIDTNQSTRRSENTYNFYTLLIDNSPYFRGWPKRSKSLIGSLSYYRAADYQGDGNVTVIIPDNDALIGNVNREDIWDTTVSFPPEHRMSIEGLGSALARLDTPRTLEGLQAFNARLASGDAEAKAKFKEAFEEEDIDFFKIPPEFYRSFYDTLIEAFTPQKLRFTLMTPSNLRKSDSEVWVQGRVVVFNLSDEEWSEHFGFVPYS